MPRTWVLPAVLAACVLLAAAPLRAQRIRGGTGGTKVDMKDVQEDPEKIRQANRRRCKELMDKAEKLLTETKYIASWQTLKSAKALLVDQSLADRWSGLAGQLNQVATASLELASQHVAREEFAQALKAYRQIAVCYGGLPAARKARAVLDTLSKHPAVQSAIREEKAQTMFRIIQGLLDQQRTHIAALAAMKTDATSQPATTAPAPRLDDLAVIKTLDDKQLLHVVDQLGRLVKACSPAPTAVRSAQLVKDLERDEVAKARLARLRKVQRAQQELARADAYRSAGMNDKAAELYRKVIKDYPGTPVAKAAATHLDALTAASETP